MLGDYCSDECPSDGMSDETENTVGFMPREAGYYPCKRGYTPMYHKDLPTAEQPLYYCKRHNEGMLHQFILTTDNKCTKGRLLCPIEVAQSAPSMSS